MSDGSNTQPTDPHACICSNLQLPPGDFQHELAGPHNPPCPQGPAHGDLCQEHFDYRDTHGRAAMLYEVAECTKCQAAKQAAKDRIQRS